MISFTIFAVLFSLLDFSWSILSIGLTVYTLFLVVTVLRFLYENLKMFADTINEYPFTFGKKI